MIATGELIVALEHRLFALIEKSVVQHLSRCLYFCHSFRMGNEIDSDAISGLWSGQYWLGENDKVGVYFSAWLTVEDGRLQGTTLEPTLYGLNSEKQENSASIRGHISPDEVVFLKTYDGVDHEPGYYEGELSDCGQQILGRWYFGWPDETSGRFELTLKGTQASLGMKTPAWEQSTD